MTPPTGERWTLRNLPFAARLTLATVLISVGVGYFSAIVQLHFQHATPGNPLPSADDAVRIFSGPQNGETPKCRLETLVGAEESEAWSGTGQMAWAFTAKSSAFKSRFKSAAKKLAKKQKIDLHPEGGP